MVYVSSTSPCRNPWLALAFVLGFSSVAVAQPPTELRTATPTTISAEIERLAEKAPPVTTLRARYRIDSVSIVENFENRFVQEGRIVFDGGDLAVYRELTSSVDDMQLLYRDGELIRYFPASGYGHRVVDGSHDKDRTDFSRYWRPFLLHLDPGATVGKTAGTGRVMTVSETSSELRFSPDRNAELAARPNSKVLEYWGPRPDVEIVTDADGRVERVERTLYRVAKSDPTAAEVQARTVARLEAPVVSNGVLVPSRIVYEITLDGHSQPYRTSTVELSDLVIGEPTPADAFTPTWPADAFLLDVEPRAPEDYLSRSGEPAIQIRLADAYLGRGLDQEAATWIDAFRQSFAGRTAKPAEVGHLARVLALAGQREEGRALHLDAIRAAREELEAAGGTPEAERELVRYLGEYAYFTAYHVGRSLHDEAGRFLEGKLDEIESPLAIADLAGRAANHYALDGRFDLARDVIARAETMVGGDAEALAWLEANRVRVTKRQEQDAHSDRIWEKVRKIRELEARLEELADAKLETPSTVAERRRLERELEELKTKP